MTCYTPIQGYENRALTKNGKHAFTTKIARARYSDDGEPIRMSVPCRKCNACRFSYSRDWAVKICHEVDMYKERGVNSSFITLTYNEDKIPKNGSLDYKGHWTKFLKRLRRHPKLKGIKIRFYMIGEYGDLNLRPHYHAIIFGYDFPDRVLHMHRNGIAIFRSKLLEELWTVPRGEDGAGSSYGYSSVGDVNPAVAAYVARYSMKKIIGSEPDTFDPDTGEMISGRYVRYDRETGEKYVVERERALMSNRDGIGKAWFDKYALRDMYVVCGNEVIKDDVHLRGRLVRPPVYYDNLLKRVNPQMLEAIKANRQDHMLMMAHESTPERLQAKSICLDAKLSKFKRQIRNVYETKSIRNI